MVPQKIQQNPVESQVAEPSLSMLMQMLQQMKQDREDRLRKEREERRKEAENRLQIFKDLNLRLQQFVAKPIEVETSIAPSLCSTPLQQYNNTPSLCSTPLQQYKSTTGDSLTSQSSMPSQDGRFHNSFIVQELVTSNPEGKKMREEDMYSTPYGLQHTSQPNGRVNEMKYHYTDYLGKQYQRSSYPGFTVSTPASVLSDATYDHHYHRANVSNVQDDGVDGDSYNEDGDNQPEDYGNHSEADSEETNSHNEILKESKYESSDDDHEDFEHQHSIMNSTTTSSDAQDLNIMLPQVDEPPTLSTDSDQWDRDETEDQRSGDESNEDSREENYEVGCSNDESDNAEGKPEYMQYSAIRQIQMNSTTKKQVINMDSNNHIHQEVEADHFHQGYLSRTLHPNGDLTSSTSLCNGSFYLPEKLLANQLNIDEIDLAINHVYFGPKCSTMFPMDNRVLSKTMLRAVVVLSKTMLRAVTLDNNHGIITFTKVSSLLDGLVIFNGVINESIPRCLPQSFCISDMLRGFHKAMFHTRQMDESNMSSKYVITNVVWNTIVTLRKLIIFSVKVKDVLLQKHLDYSNNLDMVNLWISCDLNYDSLRSGNLTNRNIDSMIQSWNVYISYRIDISMLFVSHCKSNIFGRESKIDFKYLLFWNHGQICSYCNYEFDIDCMEIHFLWPTLDGTLHEFKELQLAQQFIQKYVSAHNLAVCNKTQLISRVSSSVQQCRVVIILTAAEIIDAIILHALSTIAKYPDGLLQRPAVGIG